MKILQLLIFALALGTPPLLAAADQVDGWLTDLGSALATTVDKGSLGQVDAYLTGVRTAVSKGEYSRAGALMTALRHIPGVATPQTRPLFDRIEAEVDARLAAQTSAADPALAAIWREVRVKVAARAPAGEFDELLEKLARLAPPAAYTTTSGNAKIDLTRAVIARWQDYLTQSAGGNFEAAGNSLRELLTIATNLPIVPRSTLEALQTENTGRLAAARQKLHAKLGLQIDALDQRLVQAADSAGSAADLDSFLPELDPARVLAGEAGYSAALQPYRARLEAMRRFALRWQDYLSLRGSGATSRAQEILRSLAADNSLQDVYPRSHILDRINGAAVEPVAVVAPEALTLESLATLADQLNSIRVSYTYDQLDRQPEAARINARLVGEVNSSIVETRHAQVELLMGNPQPAVALLRQGNTADRGGAYGPVLARLQQQLALQALPRFLGLPAALRPAPDEGVPAFLVRVLQHANASRDWPLAYRTLSIVRNTWRQDWADNLSDDLRGYGLFFTALNQERALQFTEAVRSYEDSLRNAGPHLPRREIGRRLARLKQDHPKEFEAAETTSEPLMVGTPINRPGMTPVPIHYAPRPPTFSAPPEAANSTPEPAAAPPRP